jgi:hypothetical protein
MCSLHAHAAHVRMCGDLVFPAVPTHPLPPVLQMSDSRLILHTQPTAAALHVPAAPQPVHPSARDQDRSGNVTPGRQAQHHSDNTPQQQPSALGIPQCVPVNGVCGSGRQVIRPGTVPVVRGVSGGRAAHELVGMLFEWPARQQARRTRARRRLHTPRASHHTPHRGPPQSTWTGAGCACPGSWC